VEDADREKTKERFQKIVSGRIDAGSLRGLNVTIQFEIAGASEANWGLTVHEGAPTLSPGVLERPDLRVISSEDDWRDLLAGRMTLQAALAAGNLKVRGDVTLAIKLHSLLGAVR